MIDIEDRYFSLSRNLLLAVGLWPYQQSTFTRLQNIVILSILTTALIVHLATFLTVAHTADYIADVLCNSFIYMICEIKYNIFWIQNKTVKSMLEQLKRLCGELKDENELAIIEKYGNTSRRYTIVLTLNVLCGEVVFILVQSWSSVLDILLPRNESRPFLFPFTVEYFMDQQRYFYIIVLHVNAAICIANVVVLAIMTTYISALECICGIFTVVRHRIERSIRIDLLQNVNSSNRKFIFNGIITAVDIHRKAIKYTKFVTTKFDVMFFSLAMVGVISLSFYLLRIFQLLSSEYNIGHLLLLVGCLTVTFYYMFLISYMGQRLTDHNNWIFVSVSSKLALNVSRKSSNVAQLLSLPNAAIDYSL